MSEIEKYIRGQVARLVPVINFEAQVVSVDKTQDTCVVQPAEGPEIPDVKLKSVISDADQKMICYPLVESFVTVSCLRNSYTDFYVSQYSAVEQVVTNCDNVIFNGGENGGLVNWPDAKEQHDLVKQFIEAVKNACSIPVPEPGSGANSAFQAALNSAISSIDVPSFEGLEDTKVKH
jgi:hypothetical protein